MFHEYESVLKDFYNAIIMSKNRDCSEIIKLVNESYYKSKNKEF